MRNIRFFTLLCFAFATTSALCSNLLRQQADFEDDSNECSGLKASFEMESDTGCAPLTVYFLNSSEGYESYEYDFGDGIKLTGTHDESELSVHTFNNPSMYRDTTYYVTLRVTSGVCDDEMTLAVVVRSSPVADFRPESPYPADYLYPAPPIALENLIPLPDRDKLEYLWSYADACTESGYANHFSNQIYPGKLNIPDYGMFNITQHVTAPNGICSDSKILTIKIVLPETFPDFEDIPPGCMPYEVVFSNLSRYGVAFEWNFGDGYTSDEKEPTHVFTDVGEYIVTLTVMDDDLCGVSNGLQSIIAKTVVVQPCLMNNGEIPQSNPLKAWVRNEQLHVTGLAKGETLSIYTATGTLVYHSIATSDEANIPLSVQGVYIICSGNNTVKVVFNLNSQ